MEKSRFVGAILCAILFIVLATYPVSSENNGTCADEHSNSTNKTYDQSNTTKTCLKTITKCLIGEISAQPNFTHTPKTNCLTRVTDCTKEEEEFDLEDFVM